MLPSLFLMILTAGSQPCHSDVLELSHPSSRPAPHHRRHGDDITTDSAALLMEHSFSAGQKLARSLCHDLLGRLCVVVKSVFLPALNRKELPCSSNPTNHPHRCILKCGALLFLLPRVPCVDEKGQQREVQEQGEEQHDGQYPFSIFLFLLHVLRSFLSICAGIPLPLHPFLVFLL